MSALSQFLFGRKERMQQVPTISPQQQQLFSQLLGGLGGQLGGGMDVISQMLGGQQPFLEQLQEPALRQFREQTIPGIAERFTGQFGPGGQASSAFQQQLAGAGTGLAERLAGQRAELGMGAQQTGLQALMSLLGTGLGARPFETMFRPETQGFLGNILGGFGGGFGQMGGRAGAGALAGLLGGYGGGLGSLLGLLGGGR
jgi:hypothetical protein